MTSLATLLVLRLEGAGGRLDAPTRNQFSVPNYKCHKAWHFVNMVADLEQRPELIFRMRPPSPVPGRHRETSVAL